VGRRRFLGLLGAGAAGAAGVVVGGPAGRAAAVGAPAAAGPVGPAVGPDVPEPLAAPVPVGPAIRLGFPAGFVGVGWSAAAAPRVRLDGGPWRPVVAGCPTGTDSAPPATAALIPAAGAGTVEVADGTARAVNTTAGRRRPVRTGRSVPPRLGLLHAVRRAGWGADDDWLHVGDDPALELRDPPVWAPVQVLTVHHTVTANADPDPAATLRAIYDDHVHNPARDFGDIGYHVLIDAEGTVYEGRRGDDSPPLFGHRFVDNRWEMVRAAHVALNNTGNFGIALLGDLTLTPPTARARRSLVGLLAVLCLVHGLDPLGTVHYVNSADERDIDAIAMHRQWLATECPGEAFAPVFADVRADVARVLRTPAARSALTAGLPR
jgi:hypothetical protein